jgi:hypothetical protein
VAASIEPVDFDLILSRLLTSGTNLAEDKPLSEAVHY